METGDGFTLESVLGTEGMEEAIVEREALRGAVAALPERERQVILLRYFRGMTQDRTAKCWESPRCRSPASNARPWSTCAASWSRGGLSCPLA